MLKEDFLFELGCEELPSRSVLPLAQALSEGVKQAFEKAGIGFGAVKYYGTPRRIAIYFEAVDASQPPQQITRKGPAKSSAFDAKQHPTSALIGFAKSCGVALDEVAFRASEKGEWAVVEKIEPGQPTPSLLISVLQQALSTLPIAKPMFWGDQSGPFVRPVHWVLCLFGDQVVRGTFWGIEAGNVTRGHRYHFPQTYPIHHPSEYEASLAQLNVVVSFEVRREKIIQLIQEQAKRLQGQAVMNDELIDEVTSIVEWPVALTGSYSEDFLKLPEEVLIASMQAHQKCFALRDHANQLKPYFITISNIESTRAAQVVAGNEKVMRARLSDAAFFFTQDSKQPLSAFYPRLEQVLFQAKLGSVADQLGRLERLLPFWCELLNLDLQQAQAMLKLSKCDLMTGMVGEFPELQGIMGYHYAKAEGLKDATALKDQYLPRFSQDDLPQVGSLGWLFSVLNRLDVLVGIFGIGQKPTGMKDPFKLRRHALALIRMLEQCEYPLKLTECLERSCDVYPTGVLTHTNLSELKDYILERLPAHYALQGIGAEIVQSVCAVQSECLYDAKRRIGALQARYQQLAPLMGGAKRVRHLLKTVSIAECTDQVDPNLFEGQAEKDLFQAILQIQSRIDEWMAKGDYEQILVVLRELRPLIDTFFDTVMVIVEDKAKKMNRLRLLYRLQSQLMCVADLSLLNES